MSMRIEWKLSTEECRRKIMVKVKMVVLLVLDYHERQVGSFALPSCEFYVREVWQGSS
jgi:hypothetical protein